MAETAARIKIHRLPFFPAAAGVGRGGVGSGAPAAFCGMGSSGRYSSSTRVLLGSIFRSAHSGSDEWAGVCGIGSVPNWDADSFPAWLAGRLASGVWVTNERKESTRAEISG